MTDESLQATYRILDASANRAGEGLRTMEELARFVLDDEGRTAELKAMRHDLAAAIQRFPRESLLAARDTKNDVGTQIGESSEYSRVGSSDVVAAAAARTQQSLRVIEEYGKTLDPLASALIEQIRYRCYAIAADLELRIGRSLRISRLQQARLYVLVDSGRDEETFAQTLTRLLGGAVDVIQLRDQHADDRTLLRRARLGAEIARKRGKLFIMNDRADLAVAANTDGVHVGQEELPATEARQIVGPRRLVGVSTHSIDQARQAVAAGADYIGCGPVFAGRTKEFASYAGTQFLREVAAEIAIPCFAIGGIEQTNLSLVIESGIRRIAVTGAVRDAADPVAAAARLQETLAD